MKLLSGVLLICSSAIMFLAVAIVKTFDKINYINVAPPYENLFLFLIMLIMFLFGIILVLEDIIMEIKKVLKLSKNKK